VCRISRPAICCAKISLWEMPWATSQAVDGSGNWCPTSIILKMVAERIERPDCFVGFVFDGFPRTVAQAQWARGVAQAAWIEATVVVHFVIDPALLMRRITGRRDVQDGWRDYQYLRSSSEVAGSADADGGELLQRPDAAKKLSVRGWKHTRR